MHRTWFDSNIIDNLNIYDNKYRDILEKLYQIKIESNYYNIN